tara:strand:+ start:6331 stop:7851 length:1521 start_codon:yes stop_codon:yes gene_type:complete
MKKIYLFIFFLICLNSYSQIEGTWKLSPTNAAMGCGPNQGDVSWWSSSIGDVSGRDCLFDDSITFLENGTMLHYMGEETWLESWQGVSDDGCGSPIQPHDGGEADWVYVNNQLIVSGLGAHIGLPKAYNGGELTDTSDAVDEITYNITMSSSGDAFTADIQSAGNGDGWWRFEYVKTSTDAPTSYSVTLQVDASNITVGENGIYAGGGVLGGAQAVQLTDDDGDNIWEGIGTFPPTGGNYIFLNSPSNGGDWGAKEILDGLPCADPSNWNDRIMPPLTSDTTVCFEFGTCTPCGGTPPPPPLSFNVEFEVHTDSLIASGDSVSDDGIYIGGGFLGSHNALPLEYKMNGDSNMVWTGSIVLPASGGWFTILNGDCPNYDCKEDISGQICADSTNYNDRINLLNGFNQDTVIVLEYGSCVRPNSTTNIKEISSNFLIYPNPASSVVNIESSKIINRINIYNMIGNIVYSSKFPSNSAEIDLMDLNSGIYLVDIKFIDGTRRNSKFIKN